MESPVTDVSQPDVAATEVLRRIEGHIAGQVVITAFMATLVAALLVWNAPDGPGVHPAKDLINPAVRAVGLDQDWSVFAPDPRQFSVGVYAVVTRADGQQLIWQPPAKGVFFAPYRTYRWQKYDERVRADDGDFLWADAADAIAHDVGGDVRKVVLVRLFRDSQVPGASGPRPKWQKYAFFTQRYP